MLVTIIQPSCNCTYYKTATVHYSIPQYTTVYFSILWYTYTTVYQSIPQHTVYGLDFLTIDVDLSVP